MRFQTRRPGWRRGPKAGKAFGRVSPKWSRAFDAGSWPHTGTTVEERRPPRPTTLGAS